MRSMQEAMTAVPAVHQLEKPGETIAVVVDLEFPDTWAAADGAVSHGAGPSTGVAAELGRALALGSARHCRPPRVQQGTKCIPAGRRQARRANKRSLWIDSGAIWCARIACRGTRADGDQDRFVMNMDAFESQTTRGS